MTDKQQIMINGVDVSECEYLTYQLEEDGQYYWFCNIAPAGGPDECEYKPECFYKKILKQLIRKTQECEELKRKVELMMDCPDCKVDEYKKALEEIEEYIYTDCEYNDGCDRNICIRCKYSNVHDKRILDIISKVKECI